jgi:dihydrofolate reductase
MRTLTLFMHTSLDGFAAGPDGGMEWIHAEEEIFEYGEQWIREADTALYGRKTYEMMEAYWPTAADQPDATKHDIEHARWYAGASKVVLSRTMKGTRTPATAVISDDLPGNIARLTEGPGKGIILFGSPTAAHALMAANLIDEYRLFVNPVLLGRGIPVFRDINERKALGLVTSKVFTSGVVCLHYAGRPGTR